MTVFDLLAPARLQSLPRDECWQLLGTRPLGRISYCTDRGPITVPVNHVLVDGDVYFRTSSVSDLGRQLLEEPHVCFEVDDIDEFFRFGWSVLIQGRANVVRAADYPPFSEFPDPWAGGIRTMLIRIRGDIVSGRRVMPS